MNNHPTHQEVVQSNAIQKPLYTERQTFDSIISWLLIVNQHVC